VSVNAWSSTNGQLFNNLGTDLSGSSGMSITLTLPNYSGTISGKGVWLSTVDTNGQRLAVDKQL
jgi:hypothetical protein